MGKIISGGHILDEAPQRNVSKEPRREVSQEEGWGSWALRNALATPGRMGTVALGTPGDFLRTGPRSTEQGRIAEEQRYQQQPFMQRIIGELGGQRIGPAARGINNLPTTEELRSFIPHTQVRPGDEYFDLAANIAPLLLSEGMSLPGLLRGAGKTAGVMGLQQVGGAIGSQFDEPGNPRVGEMVGSLGGAALGMKTVPRLGAFAKNYPTTKLASLAEEGLAKKEVGLKKSYEKQYAIKERALESAKNLTMDAKKINKEFNKISNAANIGAETSEIRRVGDVLGSVTNTIIDNKMSIQDAIKGKKTLNKKLREQSLPPVVRDAVLEARNLLAKTIDEEARKDKKWGTAYRKAEAAYKEHAEFKPKVAKEGTERQAVEQLVGMLSSPLGKAIGKGSVAHYIANLLGAEPSTKALLTLGTAAGSEVGRQGKALYTVFKNDRPLWKRWVKAVRKSAGGQPSDLVAMIPLLDSAVQEQEVQKPAQNEKKGRIVSGGMIV